MKAWYSFYRLCSNVPLNLLPKESDSLSEGEPEALQLLQYSMLHQPNSQLPVLQSDFIPHANFTHTFLKSILTSIDSTDPGKFALLLIKYYIYFENQDLINWKSIYWLGLIVFDLSVSIELKSYFERF